MSKIAAIDRNEDSRVACVRTDTHSYHCDRSLLDELELEVGSVLNTQQLDKLIQADEVYRARKVALRLLTARGRSSRDLQNRLQKKQEFADHTIADVISWLQELGYLDDREYAEDRLQRLASKGNLGRKGLVAKLQSEGVDQLLAEEVVYETISTEQEQQWAYALVQQRMDKGAGTDSERLKRTVFSYLRRRGFEHDHIMSAFHSHQLDD